MKYCSEDENLHKLLDEELSGAEKTKLEKHLAFCPECKKSLAALRRTRALLFAQPPVLPGNNFDNKILHLIEKKTGKSEAKKGFFSVFSNFPLKLGFAVVIAIIALGVAFQLGRMSVYPLSQNESARNSSIEKEPNSIPAAEKPIVAPPEEKIVTQIRTVTKYVQVPVIKKVREEKIIYVNDSKNAGAEFPVVPKREADISEEVVAKQFNLRDLQPVGKVSYQIIRKGENNEE